MIGRTPAQEAPGRMTGVSPTPNVVTRALIAVVHAYQAVTGARTPACRFVPSCSDYALEALQRFGARRGLTFSVLRLARCRPGGGSGFDPVPGTENWGQS